MGYPIVEEESSVERINFDKFLDLVSKISGISKFSTKVFVQWPGQSTTIEIDPGSLADLDGIRYWYVSAATFARESSSSTRWPLKKSYKSVYLNYMDVDLRNNRIMFRIEEQRS